MTVEDAQKLETFAPDQIELYFSQLFNLNDYDTELRNACFLDYYLTQYWWASKQKQFNREQISIYFTAAYLLMENLRGIKFSFNL